MRKPCILLAFLATVSTGQPAFAQAVSRYNSFSYSVNEGLLQTTISDIEIDKNNYCWISFPNGIQKFDGNSFINIPVQPGLPDDKYAKFFRCTNGDLLISHSLGISKYNSETDNFSLVYKPHISYDQTPVFIGAVQDTIYVYDEMGVIRAFDCASFKPLYEFKTNLPGSSFNTEQRPQFSSNIINHKAAMKIGSIVYLFDLREKKIIDQSVIESLIYSYTLRLKSEHEVLYYNHRIKNALQCWNFITKSNTQLPIQGKDEILINRSVIFPWQNKMLISFNNRLFETDSTLQVLRSELVNFQNEPVAGNAGIHKITEDNFGNLYLQTVNSGIRKITRNNYPIRYFGSLELKENNILSVLPDKKNNRILTGGIGGLFIFDTLQRLIKQVITAPGVNRKFVPNGIIKAGDGGYIIFASGFNSAFHLDKDLVMLTPVSISSSFTPGKTHVEYFGNVLMNDGTKAIFQSQDKLYRIRFAGTTISEHQFSVAYIVGGLWYNNMIISHGMNELIFLDAGTFKEIKKIPFSEGAGIRCFTLDDSGSIYMGSNKGIFKIDTSGKILMRWNKTTGLPDECIYAMRFDKNGALWCSSNKGIFRIDKDGNLLQLTKQDGLQENEFNSNVMAVAEDGELYFGGINGVSSFHPHAIRSFDEKINLLFTAIKANNEPVSQKTAIYNIEKINLPHWQNSLSFDFVAMGNNNPDQYIYQYRFKGRDKEWEQNNGLQTIHYSLSPGKYNLQLYASRQFDQNADPMKELVIIIHPPFWKSWWFRSIVALLLFVAVSYFINQRNKARYNRRLQQIENETRLEKERHRISKDLHDSLGAYANAVLYNTELLEKENSEPKRIELIGDLKFASKDIITSLRETVWALKKEQYSAEECLVRIRNFVQPLTRYYQHIHFEIEGDAPASLVLHYAKALNVVRIVQEAVANSIKHASAKTIRITSVAIPDNKWNLSIQDDGAGFNVNELKDSEKGNGLDNMEHRAAEAGFVFSVQSTENKARPDDPLGRGTTINIIIYDADTGSHSG